MATSLAPIALFVFKRPWHTRQTVESLLRNELAESSDLFVFSDGPRHDGDRQGVREVRDYVRSIKGFRRLEIIEQEENRGLAASIIQGTTDLLTLRGRIIVVEDDLVTSKHFLRYMNDALDLYEEEPKVMHVSASSYPVGEVGSSDTYFLRVPLCWGWGTWQRAWDHFRKSKDVADSFSRGMIRRFDFDGTYPYWQQMEMNRSGRLNTWFVYWYAALFLQDALALFPRRSLVRNIGHDGTGMHCDSTDVYDVEVSSVPVMVSPVALAESVEAFEAHKRYFRSLKRSIAVRAYRRMKRVVSRLMK